MKLIRSIIFYIGYYISIVIYGSLTIFFWAMPKSLTRRIIVSWTSFAVQWAKLICGVKYDVKGLEKLQALRQSGEGFVVLSKHQSAWETFYFQRALYPACTILKQELLRLPFFGWGLRALNPIAIDRDKPREALKQVKSEGIERLNQGYNIVIFPEGTRVKPGCRGKYARSGADIASAAGKKIVPIALNAGLFWPNDSLILSPGTIQVVIGEPINTVGRSSKELTQQVEDWIEFTCSNLNQTSA